MKNNRCLLGFAGVLIIILMVACNVENDSWKGGTVIVTNNTNRDFVGRVWTDEKELFNGRIRAWNTRTFFVSDGITVYTDFECSNGNKSNPYGSVANYRTLILDL